MSSRTLKGNSTTGWSEASRGSWNTKHGEQGHRWALVLDVRSDTRGGPKSLGYYRTVPWSYHKERRGRGTPKPEGIRLLSDAVRKSASIGRADIQTDLSRFIKSESVKIASSVDPQDLHTLRVTDVTRQYRPGRSVPIEEYVQEVWSEITPSTPGSRRTR